MLREGVTVDATLAGALSSRNLTDPGMRSVFLNPETGEVWGEGEAYTNPALANTMEMMAEAGDGAQNMFYNGSIANLLTHDIQNQGGGFIKKKRQHHNMFLQEAILRLRICLVTALTG